MNREARKHLDEFEGEVLFSLNKNNLDTVFGIPDFILARYLVKQLESLLKLQDDTEAWNNEETQDYYEDMDGDAATALASAGFGTDEDYGGDLSDGNHF